MSALCREFGISRKTGDTRRSDGAPWRAASKFDLDVAGRIRSFGSLGGPPVLR
jgi:hypothetical protein